MNTLNLASMSITKPVCPLPQWAFFLLAGNQLEGRILCFQVPLWDRLRSPGLIINRRTRRRRRRRRRNNNNNNNNKKKKNALNKVPTFSYG
jgi:hypothetical protein